MPSKHGAGRLTLGQGLDKEVNFLLQKIGFNSIFPQVYQIVRKLADDQAQYDDGVHKKLSVPAVYDKIKRSNSSLNRKTKRILEDSIERVLGVLKEEATSDDEVVSIDGNFDGIENFETSTQVNLFNLKRRPRSAFLIENTD